MLHRLRLFNGDGEYTADEARFSQAFFWVGVGVQSELVVENQNCGP